MTTLLRVDAQGVAGVDELGTQLWRLQAAAEPGSLMVMGADANQPFRLGNLSVPTAQSDAATKAYVDSVASGLRIKQPVRAATASAINTEAVFVGSVIDGVTLEEGDRFLAMSPENSGHAGIWVVHASPTPPTRPVDFDAGASACGVYVFVDQGTTNGDKSFVCTTDKGVDVVGTNPLHWLQFSKDPTAAYPTAELTTPATGGLAISNDGVLALGSSLELAVDAQQVPFLANHNSFSAPNTFSDRVHFTADVPSSSGDGSVVVSGGVYVSGDLRCNSLLNESDQRLKRDIETIENGLDVVCALRGCNYTWNDEPVNVDSNRAGSRSVGVIAQEAREAGADVAVHDQGEYLAVDYTRLVPYLIEAVKSLKRRCDELSSSTRSRKRSHVDGGKKETEK